MLNRFIAETQKSRRAEALKGVLSLYFYETMIKLIHNGNQKLTFKVWFTRKRGEVQRPLLAVAGRSWWDRLADEIGNFMASSR